VEKLKVLLDEGKLVELGKEIEKIREEVNNLRRNKRNYSEANKLENELNTFINNAFEDLKEKAERFLELSPDERLKMAFILAAKSTVVEGMKTTQIRKILSMSNHIYREIKTRRLTDISAEIAKIRYILAYTASRHKSKRSDPITPILEVSDKILRKLDRENYGIFHEFLQAVVAYHIFLGGGE